MGDDGGDRPALEPDPWRTVHLPARGGLVRVGAPGAQVAASPPPLLAPVAPDAPTAAVPAVRRAPPAAIAPVRRAGPGDGRRPRDRVLVGAIGLATALLGAGVGALVLVPVHHTPRAGAARHHQNAIPVTPSTTTSVPDPAGQASPDQSAGAQPATAAGSAGGSVPIYGPASIIDPSPVATAVVPSLPLYAAPGDATPVGHLANPNWLGARLTLLVTAYSGDWVQAYVPVRPNEATAWFPKADVSISPDPYHIVVTISAHRIVLYKDNAPVFSAPVATGAPDSPTPTGSYFVAFIVKLTDPQDAYGPYAMGTSAFSNTYYSFEGGPGQVGIHGTNQPWVIGSYASHGCIRLNNSDITTLATQIPPGTPVEIAP